MIYLGTLNILQSKELNNSEFPANEYNCKFVYKCYNYMVSNHAY